MAKIKHTPDIEEIIGSRGGLVERRKTFHDYDGNVTKVGRLEAYTSKKRNYKANPIRARERANMTAFGNASHLALEFVDALKNKTPLTPPQKKNRLCSTPTKHGLMPNSKAKPILSRPKTKMAIIPSMPA